MNGTDDEVRMSRVESLKKLFKDIDTNQDKHLSYDEFYEYLSKKSGKKFNDELLNEIFRTIDRDKSSIITMEEFVSGFSKAEAIILSNIKRLKGQISESSETYTKTQRNLIEAKAKKLQNVPENNLYVVIKKAEGLKAGGVTGNKAPMVYITCEGKEVHTNAIPNPTNPEWNQSFTFPIMQGDGDVLIEVYDSDRGKKIHLLGEVVIPLRALENQAQYDDFLDLKSRNNADRPQGKILVSLQWIHDLPMYLENLVKEQEEVLKGEKEELSMLENYLKELNMPTHVDSVSGWIRGSEKVQSIEKAFSTKANVIFQQTLGKSLSWPALTKISVYLYMLLVILSNFERPDFLNVITTQLTIAVAALVIYTNQNELGEYFRFITLSLILSQIIDAVWIWQNLVRTT